MIRYITLTVFIIISLIGTGDESIELPQKVALYLTSLFLFFLLSKVVIS